MQITMSPAILAELRQAVSDIDRMMVEEQVNNDHERTAQQGYSGDAARLTRHADRRLRHVALRRRLEAVYVAIAGEDPWRDIPF